MNRNFTAVSAYLNIFLAISSGLTSVAQLLINLQCLNFVNEPTFFFSDNLILSPKCKRQDNEENVVDFLAVRQLLQWQLPKHKTAGFFSFPFQHSRRIEGVVTNGNEGQDAFIEFLMDNPWQCAISYILFSCKYLLLLSYFVHVQ